MKGLIAAIRDKITGSNADPNTVTITVTAEDLRNGHPRGTKECPVALAAQRVLGPDTRVGIDRVWTETETTTTFYGVDPDLYEYIHKIDMDEIVEPRSFTLTRIP